MTLTPALSKRPSPLEPPIDMSHAKTEKDVKKRIKQLLDLHGWFHWMPAANGYGQQGVPDHAAIKNGVYLVIEAKFGYNKPKPLQKAFAAQIIANDAFAFCVNEKNIDHLAWWLESFELATQAQSRGEPLSDDHGSRMLNAINVLTDLFA